MVRSLEGRVLNALSVVNEISGYGVLGKRMDLIGESALERVESREPVDQALEKGICFVLGDAFSASDRCANCLRPSCGYSWHVRIEKGPKTQAR
jgi:hypothetical protein